MAPLCVIHQLNLVLRSFVGLESALKIILKPGLGGASSPSSSLDRHLRGQYVACRALKLWENAEEGFLASNYVTHPFHVTTLCKSPAHNMTRTYREPSNMKTVNRKKETAAKKSTGPTQRHR